MAVHHHISKMHEGGHTARKSPSVSIDASDVSAATGGDGVTNLRGSPKGGASVTRGGEIAAALEISITPTEPTLHGEPSLGSAPSSPSIEVRVIAGYGG